MYKIDVEIKGQSPILFNRFCEETTSGAGKARPKKNTDETRREAARKTLYLNKKGELIIPPENLFACLIEAGKFEKIGKSKVTTMKSSLIPAGMEITSNEISFKTKDFEVDTRSVVIPSTGGRVMKDRGRLDNWCLSFTLQVDEEMFSEDLVRTVVDNAGSKIGLGDYRPSRKGSFGKFKVSRWKKTV